MFYPPIYLGILFILVVLFFCTRDRRVERLIIGAFIFIVLCALADMAAHAGEVVRDASGKIITRSSTAGRVETVRDASGRLLETRAARQGVTTVRDANGKILRTERK